ncbi:MAG: shikimate kinase, partial [Oscillospiraceae bacterium]
EQKTIAQIFAEQGEIAFRDIETACVKKVSKKRGQVIATGGGVVLRKENMDALSENGILIFIDRPIADIANENLSDRPLLAADKNQLFALYEQRIFLYRSYGEWIVNFAGTPEEIAAWITERAKEKEQ